MQVTEGASPGVRFRAELYAIFIFVSEVKNLNHVLYILKRMSLKNAKSPWSCFGNWRSEPMHPKILTIAMKVSISASDGSNGQTFRKLATFVRAGVRDERYSAGVRFF